MADRLQDHWLGLDHKSRVLLENYYLPGDLERQIGAFVEYHNNQRFGNIDISRYRAISKPHCDCFSVSSILKSLPHIVFRMSEVARDDVNRRPAARPHDGCGVKASSQKILCCPTRIEWPENSRASTGSTSASLAPSLTSRFTVSGESTRLIGWE